VVLVTGGSRGIGLALARAFAARGHELVLVARNAGDLERAAEAIRAEHGVAVTPLPFDLTTEGAARGVLAAIDAAGGYVDTLVNCAGIGVSGAFAESAADEVRGAISVNIESATTLMQACLPGMVARGRGGVLNVASLAGLLPMPRLALYGATKSYLVALSRAVAAELAGSGVTVSVLLPGPVDTSFFARNSSAEAKHTSLLPGLSADAIAEIAIGGYLARQTVITPGMLAALCRVGLKLLPTRMLASLVRGTLGAADRASSSDTARSSPRPATIAPNGRSERWRDGLQRLVFRNGPTCALAVLGLLYLLLAGLELRKAPYFDPSPQGNVGVAAGLLKYGVYGKAFVQSPAELAPGRYLAPGYPALIAGVALIDTRMADGLQCLMVRGPECLQQGNPFRLLFVLHALAGLAALTFTYLLARELSGSPGLASLAAVLVLVMGRYHDYTALVLPYGLLPAFALGLCLTLLLAHRRRSLAMAALGGTLIGALALLEAYYAALWLIAPVLVLCAERARQDRSWGFALRACTVMVAATGLVLGPWMMRNYQQFGDVALVDGSAITHFAERAAYVGLRGRDLLVAAFFWLPAVGDLALTFLPRSTTVRFDAYYEGSLLREAGNILAATRPPTGGPGHFSALVQQYVLGDPLGYAMSTVLLAERGMRSTGGLFVLWGWLTLPVLVWRLRAQRDVGPFLMAAGPLLAMVVVQALLTANLAWMNLPLLFVYAYAIVKVTGGLELPFAVRRLFASDTGARAIPGAPAARPEVTRRGPRHSGSDDPLR
jgi:short-subunit dehydrogenase